jgi:hypothetical protein
VDNDIVINELACTTAGDSVLYLPLDTNYLDISDSNNSVSCTDCPSNTTEGKIYGAYVFSNDSLEIADASSLDVDNITLATWINPSQYLNDQRIISKETGTSEPYSIYSLLLSGSGEKYLDFRLGINNQRKTLSGTTAIELNTWTHVVASYDGANMKLFVNGVLTDTIAASGNIQDNNNPVYIGGSQFYPRFFSGSLDDVRIYNRALSQEEIQDLAMTSPGEVVSYCGNYICDANESCSTCSSDCGVCPGKPKDSFWKKLLGF